MRARRKKASKDTIEFYADMSDHFADHFDKIMEAMQKYDETKIMEQMNELTCCYWSTHFINGNIREGFTLEQDIDNFVTELRRLILENIRKAHHYVEGNERKLN